MEVAIIAANRGGTLIAHSFVPSPNCRLHVAMAHPTVTSIWTTTTASDASLFATACLLSSVMPMEHADQLSPATTVVERLLKLRTSSVH